MGTNYADLAGISATAFFDGGGDAWKPAAQTQHPTELNGRIVSPNLMAVSFATLPGNKPATNGNLLAVWQSAFIPYGVPPLQKHAIVKNEESGDQVFEFPIQSKPYVVGYGTSDSGTAWASTLTFTPGAGVDGKPFVVKITVNTVRNDSLTAEFWTPLGNIPSANKNWVGLWKGPVVTFDGSNRIGKAEVTDPQNHGFVQMNGLNLTINTAYSLAYAVGPKDSDIAGWVSFVTVPF